MTKSKMSDIGHSKIEITMMLRGLPTKTWEIIDTCLSPLELNQKAAFTWVLLLQDKKKDAAQIGDVGAVNMLNEFLYMMWRHQPTMLSLASIDEKNFRKCIEVLDICGIPASNLDLEAAAAR
ncbi:hypothetical protein [Vibrio sp. HN007]|uniref:hypothetical protein n=1 Tax=Vibrio iocasae TaxID=3098914 RepID=UPI0035D43CBA